MGALDNIERHDRILQRLPTEELKKQRLLVKFITSTARLVRFTVDRRIPRCFDISETLPQLRALSGRSLSIHDVTLRVAAQRQGVN